MTAISEVVLKRGFLAFVIGPTALAAIYLTLFAADRYVSEAQFVIRNPMAAALSQLSSMVPVSGSANAPEEAAIVHTYLVSRDAVRDIAEETNLRDALARPVLDVIWRYPRPFAPHNEERLFAYFRSIASVSYDKDTGISTLSVQAFSAVDAASIASTLLKHAERLLNRLSSRSHADALSDAESDLQQAQSDAKAAHQSLTDFRLRNSVVDPTRTFDIVQETLLELAKARALAATQRSEVLNASAQSPQIPVLQARIEALDEQMLAERKRLAGADDSIGLMISEYETLVLKREFAEQSLSSASAAMEAARLDTQRQELYLELVSEPSTSDRPAYPHRFLGILAVFLVSLSIYSVVNTLVEEIRAHAGR